ncbi:hypothetical protein D3C87_1351830 [compost metagenome]
MHSDDSPPKPSPCSMRNTSSCSGEFAMPHRKHDTANTMMVQRSTRTRPKRSASSPAPTAPTSDETSVQVTMAPAIDLLMPHCASSVEMRKE